MERKNITKLLLFIFSILVAIIIGVIFSSLNAFFSLLLIEFWFFFTIIFFKKRKKLNEYNSPRNTSFFVIVPMILGLFYSFWGLFSPFLIEEILSISIWRIFFALPYIIFGLNSLISCYNKKKFNLVYLYKRRSMDPRKFAYVWNIFLILTIAILWILYFEGVIPLNPVNYSYDFITLIAFILLIIYPGLLGRGSSFPLLSTAQLTRRMQTIDSISTPPSPTQSYSQTSRTKSRTTPRLQQTKTVKRTKAKSKSSQPRARQSVKKKLLSTAVFNKFKPKAGIINIEDFKCIFCFKLPKMPDDRNIGVILCPNCRYPAHANEFKDWLSSSKLCSRCDTQLPASFIHNPKVISTANYVKVIQKFRSRRR